MWYHLSIRLTHLDGNRFFFTLVSHWIAICIATCADNQMGILLISIRPRYRRSRFNLLRQSASVPRRCSHFVFSSRFKSIGGLGTFHFDANWRFERIDLFGALNFVWMHECIRNLNTLNQYVSVPKMVWCARALTQTTNGVACARMLTQLADKLRSIEY